MQKDVPQPTDVCANASAQLLSPQIDIAHEFLMQNEGPVRKLLCSDTGTVNSDITALGSDSTALFTAIATGVGAIIVPWLAASKPGIVLPAALSTAAVTISALVTAIIMKIGVAEFCRLGVKSLDKGTAAKGDPTKT